VARRFEVVAFVIDADDETDARERFWMDGEEVASWYTAETTLPLKDDEVPPFYVESVEVV
jgi:hypothetical protein